MSHPMLARRIYRRAILVPYWRVKREMHAWRHAGLPPVLETSIPKSGTHLLKGALLSIGYRHAAHQPLNPDVHLKFDPESFRPVLRKFMRGELITEHLRWTQALEDIILELGYKIFFIYRDPRAVCLSFIHYHLNSNFRFGDFMRSLPDTRSRIEAVLTGIAPENSTAGHGRAPLADIYDAFRPWKNRSSAWCASFEELIGESGGGSSETQAAAVTRMLNYLGVDASDARVHSAASKIFNPKAATFRSGHAEGWRTELSSDEIELLNSRLERQILEWGYKLDA